uniref:Uncharacterized protein n=1 Tax=Oryza meridionalis TaxID=40149 RepID=A0A0E0CRV2_9ORYZ
MARDNLRLGGEPPLHTLRRAESCPQASQNPRAGIYSPNAYRGFAREFIKDLERMRTKGFAGGDGDCEQQATRSERNRSSLQGKHGNFDF